MSGGLSRTAALAAVALLASACNMTPGANTAPAANPASNAATAAPPAAPPPAVTPQGAYQLILIAGSASQNQDAIRMNTVTGQTSLSANTLYLVPVSEPSPLPAGNYRLYSWSTLDSGATTREWDVYRLDVQSGRLWDLNFDGNTTANWVELGLTAPPPPAAPAAPAPAPAPMAPAQAPQPGQ